MDSEKSAAIFQKLKQFQVVPVVSLPSVEAAMKLAELLCRCNLPVIEITFRTDFGAQGMSAISEAYPDMLLLAGTVLSSRQVDAAIDAGASAIVSPGFTAELADYCRKMDIPFLPGVCTPSEIQQALEAGLQCLKFFPAESAGGVKMISMFESIYQDVTFMPTGGIKLENLDTYLERSNIICCGGTWLSPQELMESGDWSEIERRVTLVGEKIAELRNTNP